jgi:hypothetical protein
VAIALHFAPPVRRTAEIFGGAPLYLYRITTFEVERCSGEGSTISYVRQLARGACPHFAVDSRRNGKTERLATGPYHYAPLRLSHFVSMLRPLQGRSGKELCF